jgi:hypothetical protein
MEHLLTLVFVLVALALLQFTPAPTAFSATIPHVAADFDTASMPYDAFDELPSTQLEIGGGVIEVAFAPGELTLPRARVMAWVTRAAQAVTEYYGRFPVEHLRLLIIPHLGTRVLSGTAYGYRGPAIKIALGHAVDEADLERDWIMAHEMVHLGFPFMPDEHGWAAEGIATYVEPLARIRVGQLRAEKMWNDLMDGLPKGLPRPGDRGLDRTHTWGRTYWGGALFFLLADIEIRQRTDNRHSLQDALRAINAAGGNIANDMPLTQAFRIGDQATGVPVLTELYLRMQATPVTVDLEDLWLRLGVNQVDGRIRYNDAAPLASVRRALTGEN